MKVAGLTTNNKERVHLRGALRSLRRGRHGRQNQTRLARNHVRALCQRRTRRESRLSQPPVLTRLNPPKRKKAQMRLFLRSCSILMLCSFSCAHLYDFVKDTRFPHCPLFGEGISFSWLSNQSDVIGGVLRTQDNTKPVFVSVGHRISLVSALNWITRLSSHYRLPETTRAADHAVRDYLKHH